MSKRFDIIEPAMVAWHDGMPYAVAFDDVYYSKADGLNESMHVFIAGNDLIRRFAALQSRDVFVVAETGFGTGLNCLLTWQLFLKHAPQDAKLVIYSAEKHPLTHADLIQSLKAWPALSREANALIAAYPSLTPGMHTLLFEAGRVCIHLMLEDALLGFQSLLVSGKAGLEQHLRPWCVNAWMLDGFSPAKNADLWSAELFEIIALLSSTGTTVASFSVAGHVRRGLAAVQCVVRKQPGFGSKRHCLQGVFQINPSLRQSERKPRTPWAVALPKKKSPQSAIVIGAGLAGCFVAHALSKRGIAVRLVDAADDFARGGSGVQQAVLYPHLSAYASPLSCWMQNAFLFASRTYGAWLKAGKIAGELKGILQFDLKKSSVLAKPVDAGQASDLAGIQLASPALFVPGAGWLDTRVLCEFLISTPGIHFQPNTVMDALPRGDEVVVLANAAGANTFFETHDLPLDIVPGQMTAIQSSAASGALKLPLCGEAHVLPMINHLHWLGASYDHQNPEIKMNPQNNDINLAKLAALPTHAIWSNEVMQAWAGARAKTPDYLPLVGPVPDSAAFQVQFKGLSQDAGRLIASPGIYHDHLYVCVGFGSRGLTSIPLAAEYLAALICHEPSVLSQKMATHLSPARFLVKSLRTLKRTL